MILNNEQLAERDAALMMLRNDRQIVSIERDYLDTIADLKRQLAERDTATNEAQAVTYFTGVKHGADIALRDAAIIASQINHEAASAIADMSSDSCVELQKKSAKLIPFVRALDAYVREVRLKEAEWWAEGMHDHDGPFMNTCIFCQRLAELRAVPE